VIFFDGKDIGPIIFLVVRGDRILYHIFGRDRGYDIIYTKKGYVRCLVFQIKFCIHQQLIIRLDRQYKQNTSVFLIHSVQPN
jgi:hypothetical protein